jgi:hypothetical protein
MLFKNSVRTSKRTPHFTITKINWLTLFKFKALKTRPPSHSHLLHNPLCLAPGPPRGGWEFGFAGRACRLNTQEAFWYLTGRACWHQYAPPEPYQPSKFATIDSKRKHVTVQMPLLQTHVATHRQLVSPKSLILQTLGCETTFDCKKSRKRERYCLWM